MAKYRLFLDRRVWSNGSVVVDAETAEEALQCYHRGLLEDCIDRIVWDYDDIELSLVDVGEDNT